jgi:hypothetical protein
MDKRFPRDVGGRIRWFPESPGIGNATEAMEFVTTAALGLPDIGSYRTLDERDQFEPFVCRVRRSMPDLVELSFLAPEKALPLVRSVIVLIQGPYPIARVIVTDVRELRGSG